MHNVGNAYDFDYNNWQLFVACSIIYMGYNNNKHTADVKKMKNIITPPPPPPPAKQKQIHTMHKLLYTVTEYSYTNNINCCGTGIHVSQFNQDVFHLW